MALLWMCFVQRCETVNQAVADWLIAINTLQAAAHTPDRLNLRAVEQVKSSSAGSRPTALITTAEGRYFSIGYQLAKPKILSEKFRLLVADLISLSMPTIAAVNGLIHQILQFC
ncbi:hypothetical protein ACS0TY_004556 [Phlomoides rotata]